MNWQHIVTVYLKELKDSLRDRRTLISMIVIPTLRHARPDVWRHRVVSKVVRRRRRKPRPS